MPDRHGAEGQADEGEEGSRAASAAGSGDDEAQGRGQALAQGQPDQAEAPEGGGAAGAPLTANGHAPARGFEVDADDAGNVSRITFLVDGGEDVVMQRPEEGSNEMLLWRLYETTRFQFRRRRTELQSAINRAHSILASHTSSHQGRNGAAAPRSAPEAPCPAPREINWKSKPLPARVVQKLQGFYFLEIEELLQDRHGNPYVPTQRNNASNRLQWRGSMLGGRFPHAVVSMKDPGEGVSSRSHQFICAENNVHVVVKLMKRVEGGRPEHVSETAVLSTIEDAFSPAQRATWGELDGKMWLYSYLEFEDGTPVGASDFENPPDFGHLLKPAESLPSYLQNDDPGYYEFKMQGGVGCSTFSFADRVTNKNLKAEHKLKRKRFRLVVKALNYHLVGLEGFTAYSSPFLVKGVLHNDVKANERYVMTAQGQVVDSPLADVPK